MCPPNLRSLNHAQLVQDFIHQFNSNRKSMNALHCRCIDVQIRKKRISSLSQFEKECLFPTRAPTKMYGVHAVQLALGDHNTIETAKVCPISTYINHFSGLFWCQKVSNSQWAPICQESWMTWDLCLLMARYNKQPTSSSHGFLGSQAGSVDLHAWQLK